MKKENKKLSDILNYIGFIGIVIIPIVLILMIWVDNDAILKNHIK